MNYYQTLQVSAQASTKEIKLAYRKLAKIYHPDTKACASKSSAQVSSPNNEEIITINAAYEILSNPQSRRQYDQSLQFGTAYESLCERQTRTAKASQGYNSRRRQESRRQTLSYQEWIQVVYLPSDRSIQEIIQPLDIEIDNLSADPFDDELLGDFQAYLEDCRHHLQLAKQRFAIYPNPPQLANVAANFYYCLNHLEDGIKDLECFVFNYDEHYLHTGQELFRIASHLICEAENNVNSVL